MDFSGIEQQLDALITELQYSYMQHIADSGHSASGNLALNQKHRISFDGRYYHIYLELEDYWKYLENGTKPHFPPVEKIAEWIRVKPVLPRANQKTGKVPTKNQLAFLIARSISVKGTKPTHLLQQTMNDFKLQQKVKNLFIEAIKRQTTSEL